MPQQRVGIGPYQPIQPMVSHVPPMTPMVSHDVPTDNSKLYDFFKGMGQNLGSDVLWLDSLAGLPFKPLNSILPEGISQWLPGNFGGHRTEMENWAEPQNKEQLMGNLWGSVATPGPDELLAGAKGMKMLGLGASLDDVAKRMGKPPGSLTSNFEKFDSSHGDYYKYKVNDSTYHDNPAASITFGTNPISGHLPIHVTHSEDDYLNKGLGTEMYKEVLEKAKGLGYSGIASDPDMRNNYSNQIWDRPGITRVKLSNIPDSREYDLMSEYIPRGRDWEGTPIKNLFTQDKADQPMIPEVKNYLLDQMRNKSTDPNISYTPLWLDDPDNKHMMELLRNRSEPRQLPFNWYNY